MRGINIGEENFSFEILARCELDDLFNTEKDFADKMKPEYNSMEIGWHRPKVITKGRKYVECLDCGKKLRFNDGRQRRCSKCYHKYFIGEKHHNYKRPRTKETKDKISKFFRENGHPNRKRVRINGIEYESKTAAANALNIDVSLVNYRLRKKYDGYEKID